MIGFAPAQPAAAAGSSHALLWTAYRQQDASAIDALLAAYLPLVNRVMERISVRLPSHVAIDDLSQTALVGLYKAIVDFQPERGVPFEGHAYPRIRGAVLDELRAQDPLSRDKRKKVEHAESMVASWMKEHGNPPTEEAIAAQLDMSVEDFNLMMDQAKPWCSLDAGDGDALSLHETIADPNGNAEAGAHRHDTQQLLRAGFRQLDMREQKVLYLYYFEELRLSEIAQLFNLTEARVSQIHALGVVRLRAALAHAFPAEFVA